MLVDLQEMTIAEAAAVLDVAEGTVKSRCARGRAALAEMLLGRNPGGPAHVAGSGPRGTAGGPSTRGEAT